MTSISLTWLLITTFSLFALVGLSPSGPKAALKQVVSTEVYWSGAFLSLTLALTSIVLWIFREPLSVLFGSSYETFTTNWQSLVSTVFGAFLWILISLWLTTKPRAHWLALSLLYVILMTGLNYAPVIQPKILKLSYILGSEDEALSLVAAILLGISIIILTVNYIKHRKCLISKNQNSFDCRSPTLGS
ncbi:hypothetical protein [Pseudomonas sp. dw_612]|uniref:hypothetical protein n=1 Tax=Pseudomonas sp. dw_612 TaxID=2720080 RepID=UPI001BD269A7|nr:hypothetical protein [Pseudomonas sp. dw_612]